MWFTKQGLKSLVFFIFLFPFIVFLIPSCSFVQYKNNNYQTYVSEIIDGDTFKTKLNVYRLLGIDTPEIKDNNNNLAGLNNVKYDWAIKAKNQLSNLISNKYVEIEKVKIDKYNRIVSKVFVNGLDVNYFLVKNGLAIPRYISSNKKSPFYYEDKVFVSSIWKAKEYAENNKLGFWSLPENQINLLYNGLNLLNYYES